MIIVEPEWKYRFREQFGNNPEIEKFISELIWEVIKEIPDQLVLVAESESFVLFDYLKSELCKKLLDKHNKNAPLVDS